jgi:NADH-quinone oxidoreductase subunit H
MDFIYENPLNWLSVVIMIAVAVVALGVILTFVMYAIYFERKVIGWMQWRIGPNRVGPFGLLQTAADVLKLLLKEDVIPSKADKALFILAPVIAFVPSFAVIATLPITGNIYATDLNVGLLYYIALSGITTLGMVLGGWASNNKLSLLGGMRAAAQMVSYEVPLVMSLVGVIMLSGSLSLKDIVEGQAGGILTWNFIPQILGFAVFIVAAISEINRTPFDLPEAENELVAGYFVEYTGFRFAFFMLTEYVYVFGVAALATALFLGGWHAPIPWLDEVLPGLGIVWFALKFAFIVFSIFWIRATYPRVRIDQLMGIGWKYLLPLALLNIFLTALVKELFY